MKTRIITGLGLIGFVAIAFILRAMDQTWSVGVFVGFTSIFAAIAFYEVVRVKGASNNWDLVPYIVTFLLGSIMLFVKLDTADGWSLSINYDKEPGISMVHLTIFLAMLLPLPVFFKKYNSDDVSFLFITTLFVGLIFATLNYIGINSWESLILIVAIAASTDTFAYFGGSFFGKHKLIERISPKKTWEGSIIGTAFGTGIGALLLFVWPASRLNELGPNFIGSQTLWFILIPLIISIVSQIGDLTLSAIKRHNKIKDFSNIFPGHGGVLDRIDSIAPASITLYIIFTLLA